MGTYTFKWAHPASEVFVTGTFDNWGKTLKMEKIGDVFEKTVHFPDLQHKIYYKFVADGQWTYDHTVDTEADSQQNINNILTPDHLTPLAAGGALAAGMTTISSVAPASSTAALAGAVPKEGSSDLPGAFPETPSAAPVEDKTLSVNPIPATAGAGNPIKLAPGEKVPDPSTLTSNTVSSTATTDAASYEKAGVAGIALPNSAAAIHGAATNDPKAFDLPPVGGNMIPESSLPMGAGAGAAGIGALDAGPTIQSAAPTSTTAMLAGQVPLEPKGVPAVVEESNVKANTTGEAETNPVAVQDKSAVEQELKAKVPEEPPAAQSGFTVSDTAKKAGEMAAAGTAAAGAALAAGAVYAKESAASASKNLPPSVQDTVASVTGGTGAQTTASTVPAVVSASEKKAKESPEATANPTAVAEKSAVEQELLAKVPETNAAGAPAPTEAAATSPSAPAATTGATLSPATAAVGTAAGAEAERSRAAGEKPPGSRDVSPMSRGPTNASGEPLQTVETASGWKEGMEPPPHKPKKDLVAAQAAAEKASGGSKKKDEKKKDEKKEGNGAAAAPAAGTSSPTTSSASKTTTGTDDGKGHKKRHSFFGKLKEKLEGHKK